MPSEAKLLGWCVCANISDHLRGGTDESKFYQGTRMFSPGTKVYLGSAYWGPGGERLHVIGLRRISRDFINCAVHIGTLENIRTTTIYSQKLWKQLAKLNAERFASKADADEYEGRIIRCHKTYRPEKLATETKTGPWGDYESQQYRNPEA